MRNLLLALLHVAVVTAKLCGAGGVRAVMAENLLLKQQLIVLRRARKRAPNGSLASFRATTTRHVAMPSLDGHTPVTFAGGRTGAPAHLNGVRWVVAA